MLDTMYLPVLLAQQQSPSFVDSLLKILYIVGILGLVFVVPFVLGTLIARSVRMRGYEFKFGVVLCSLFLALLVLVRAWDFQEQRLRLPLGVDLKGGVILIYEIDVERTIRGTDAEDVGDINMNDLVQALTNRINPSGTKEIVIRPYGEQQVEIIIPEVETEEVEVIKQLIRTAGSLEFRIVANSRDHGSIIAAADEQSQSPIADVRFRRRVMDGEEMIGFWAQAAKEKLKAVELERNILRDPATGRIVTLAEVGPIESGAQGLDDYLASHGMEHIDVLLATDDGCNVTGDFLGVVSAGNDEYLNPCVNFRLRGEGARLFSLLTSANRPNMNESPPFYRHLGIMLDERLISFPRLITTISDSGRITGDFSKEEVDFLVGILRAGRLPATLQPEPISENNIGSMLGDDTIRKGKVSIVVSMLAVLAFVAVYYRFSGIVACAALLMNLVLIMAVMVLLNAPLTLPGLAGLVLTIGMSVDANVLIFERMREELARGAAVRMAIRNGFARATTTIVDANVTTLITGMVLYAIGTDQIRGFAVTLILGILMSMYTAIFCSRLVFDTAERNQWIKELKMMKLLGSTRVDFIGKQKIMIAVSLLVIVVGLVAVGMRGKRIFDIDFNGGLSVTMVLRQTLPPDEVRARLNDHFRDADPPVSCSVNTVSVEGLPPNSVYKIDADIQDADVAVLEDAIKETFQTQLQTYAMEFGSLKQVEGAGTADTNPAAGAGAAKRPGGEPPADAKPATPAESNASQDAAPAEQQRANVDPPTAETTPAADTPAEPPATDAPAPAAEPSEAAPAPETPAVDPAAPSSGENADGGVSRRADLPADTVMAWAGPLAIAQDEPPSEPAQEPATAQQAAAVAEQPAPSAETVPATDAAAPQPPASETVDDSAATTPGIESAPEPAAPEAQTRTVAQLTLGQPMSAPTLREKIRQAYNQVYGEDQRATGAATNAAGELTVPGLLVSVNEQFNWNQQSAATSGQWYVTMIASQADAEQVLIQLKTDLSDTPVFPSSSKIGGKVAGDTRNLAIAALMGSLLGIVGYIWIRFQRVVFGVAAAIALVHDVLITLGAIAISAYFAKPLGFLLIDEFRISLPIVAAFLTIIGYSLNDTIVIFDRIREVRGKSPDLTADMINASINQTLSRTMLTSLTTLIVVIILYAIGGQGIHGFAFAMVVGVVVGTYSSIFIASPILLWMFSRSEKATS